MGLKFHGHKRDVDKEKHLRRMHQSTPWIESPLVGADHNSLVFSQRHEANSIELFFDLFFVANLATFTAYHSITDGDYLLGYVGFFGILWSTWFQITLHDVRFARDSLYERICKTVQFICFVGLALVGSQFNPASPKGDNINFRILCYTLVICRGLLAIQYLVVLFFTWKEKYAKLYLPLGLMFLIYAIAMGAFAAMTPAFQGQKKDHRLVYLVWYVVVTLEAIAAITISCCWRMLSFKKTHLMERMSLLTIIVIGEGAIGVTKTVSRLMGKHGLDVEGCFLIMCIIIILVFIWALYFDNFPHGHYGTIRQQIWSLLHFPFQLAIVGVVEGSQQLALARYTIKNALKVEESIMQYCDVDLLDGAKLRDKLMYLLSYFELDSKIETTPFYHEALEAIYKIGNETGICSAGKAAAYMNGDEGWPMEFVNVSMSISNGIYVGLGMKIPSKKLDEFEPLEIAVKGWELVYMYYWSCFCVLILCLILFLFLIRRHKADLFDYTSVISRFLVLGVGAALLGLWAEKERLYQALGSPMLLPICVILLFLVMVSDRLSSIWCNWRLKKSGKPYALEVEEHEHGHGGGHDAHGEIHERAPLQGHGHHDSVNLEDARKSAHYSVHTVYTDTSPLSNMNTEYKGQHEYAMEPLMSPPLTSPPLMSPDPSTPGLGAKPTGPGGYMAVSSGQNYGA
ncbi:bacterial low temperature requirement A protein-domain-containing protein [Phaeosphaeria sp. MPI-PUGE-AT-0046c]|nr:bacterial low temperature requirement A protein-domain-containing protein [Phaeosphaeria sp. MPI-PUGE-AT-0046c]